MPRTIYTDREAAREEVAALTQWEVNPTLTPIEIYDLLERARRCSFWAASTDYLPGDLVLPATATGHSYMCITGGTSDSTEPDWTTRQSGINQDGPTDTGVQWVEHGAAFKNAYDIREAVYRGWMLKAAKASKEIDVTLAGGASAGTFTAKCAQIYEHCINQALKSFPYRIS